MKAKNFLSLLEQELGVDFYTGVPDSLLQPLTNQIMESYGISETHMVAVNEGNAVALAAGHHLSTGKIPCVYMQNSGQGNIVNPFASLLHQEVYQIPCVFIVGWRGEPGITDEPQHVFQGKITCDLMDLLGIENRVLGINTTDEEIDKYLKQFKNILEKGNSVCFVISQGALETTAKPHYSNGYLLNREDILREIVNIAEDDIFVCTTGKASRELFELRKEKGQTNVHDFLTVGSMGHSSSIALKIALNKKDVKVWCVDGDGALLMHMGAMAVIGSVAPENFIHILINNEAHETVGGMPTVASTVDFSMVAKGCGYKKVDRAKNLCEVRKALLEAKQSTELTFLELNAALGTRGNLGRPTTTPVENKKVFMEYLRER